MITRYFYTYGTSCVIGRILSGHEPKLNMLQNILLSVITACPLCFIKVRPVHGSGRFSHFLAAWHFGWEIKILFRIIYHLGKDLRTILRIQDSGINLTLQMFKCQILGQDINEL